MQPQTSYQETLQSNWLLKPFKEQNKLNVQGSLTKYK